MTTRTHAGVANDALTRRLIDLASRGQRPRCGDSEVSWMFLDEDPRTRAIAATYCTGCLLIEPCAEVGRYQTFGVFGSVDVTRRPGRKKAA